VLERRGGERPQFPNARPRASLQVRAEEFRNLVERDLVHSGRGYSLASVPKALHEAIGLVARTLHLA
jgi:hypothetical protein